MRFFLSLLILPACGTSPAEVPVVEEVNPGPILDAVNAVQPEPLIELIETPHAVVGTEEHCPSITVIDSEPDTLKEHWQGGCALANGLQIDGELERLDGPDGAWISGSGFRVHQDNETVFALDGVVEVSVSGNLWLIDAAAALCGTEHWACSQGSLSLDLAFTVYPAALFPQDYDATVSGAFGTDNGTFTLDGAWSIDERICGVEATSGVLSVQQRRHHALKLNGSEYCDGCLDWQVQGQPTPGLCGLNL